MLKGLFRLAPHASHDQRTLVLKKCSDVDDRWVDESAWTAELWPRGVFVFQRPSDAAVVIWTGAKCGIEGGAMAARRLVENAARAKAFAVPCAKTAACTTSQSSVASDGDVQLQIVDVRGPEGDDGGRFEYAAELQWYLDDLTTSNKRQEPAIDAAQEILRTRRAEEEGQSSSEIEAEALMSTLKAAATPLLFVLESLDNDGHVEDSAGEWERLKQYDAQDLTPQDAFLLMWAPPTTPDAAATSPAAHAQRRLECFVWIGADCSLDIQRVVDASRRHITAVFPSADSEREGDSSFSVTVERQNSESDCFWHVFELGY